MIITNQLLQIMFPIILVLLVATAACCPTTVKNQIELVALPVGCFQQLYNSSIHDGHKISRIINERLETYKRMLQQIKMQDWEHLKTTPVLKWAQSESQIFISFKLSHRQDSPTCSDIRSQSFRTTNANNTEGNIPFEKLNDQGNSSEFSYSGECYFTSQKLLFTLNLKFQAFLSKITLRKQGLGLYALVGDKIQKSIWGNPFNDFRKAAIWPEIRQKYESDMNKFFEMTQKSDQSPRKGRKRRPTKEKGEKVEAKAQQL